MTVKSEKVDMNKEEINDDLTETEAPSVDTDKLAALKAKLASKAKEAEKPKKDKSVNFGVIGIGAGGSNVAVKFFKEPHLYQTLVINTARQDLDLLDIPDTQKIFLDAGVEGAAKQQSVGKEIAEVYRDTIASAVKKQLNSCQMFIVATSTGGGTGSGAVSEVVDILNETGKPVLLLALLPMASEDASIKSNSVNSMEQFADMVKEGKVANIIYADNSKIEQIYSDVSYMDFFDKANVAITEPICEINRLSAMPAKTQAFDSAELIRLLLDGNGCISYAKIEIDYQENEDPIKIAGAIQNSLETSLLSTLDIETANLASMVIVGSKATWDKIPATNINYASSIFTDKVKGAVAVFKGYYVDDAMEDDVLKIYSIFSGLHMPEKRLQDLRDETAHLADIAKKKEVDKAKSLSFSSGSKEKHMSKIDEVKAKIAKSNSGFGKFLANNNNTIDRRKK